MPISYRGRTYEEGKKITWWDGVRTVWKIIYYRLVDDIYDDLYGHAILYRLSQTHHFNRWMVDTVKPWIGKTVLEIGAGLGNLTTKLIPRQFYTASDIDPLHLDYLRSRFGSYKWMEVREIDLGNPADFEPIQERFDTIVCLNVLEHIQEDEQALENMYRTLVPGGVAIILVPQGQWLYGSVDRIAEHCRRYSRRELTEKCEGTGFTVEKIIPFNRVSLLPWYINTCILQRTNFSKVQLKLFDSLIWLWRRIDRFLPLPGLSLIVVAQKPAAPPTSPGN